MTISDQHISPLEIIVAEHERLLNGQNGRIRDKFVPLCLELSDECGTILQKHFPLRPLQRQPWCPIVFFWLWVEQWPVDIIVLFAVVLELSLVASQGVVSDRRIWTDGIGTVAMYLAL